VQFKFIDNKVNNWIFKGRASSLIDKKYYGMLRFEGNYFSNIGYIETNLEGEKHTHELPIEEPDQSDAEGTAKSFKYSREALEWRSTVGIFNIENS